jgi:replicative DNA helicase
MNDRIEILILKSLIYNEEYSRKVIPFIKAEYFQDDGEKTIFEKTSAFILTYNNRPSKEAVAIQITGDTKLSQGTLQKAETLLAEKIVEPEAVDVNWLYDQTEQWCKEQAVFNAIKKSIAIFDDKSGKVSQGVIPQILTDALAVSFNTNVGHDYVRDSALRYDQTHKVEEKIPFDLKMMNRITKGGLPKKTLNIILAGTGVGKTLAMGHMASAALLQGKNVLYITLEMAGELIGQRIDANLLNVGMDDLMSLSKIDFGDRMNRMVMKNHALSNYSLKIVEYPTATASALNFKALLDDLRLKENFAPDVIFVDYINLAISSRLGTGSNVNSYYYVKAIAEELRGLAVQYNAAVISATQTTRGGYANTDPGLEDTSESFGLPATADFMMALVTSEELEQRGQIKVKQLKNRYNDPSKCRKFLLGIDKSKMRLFDLEDSAQEEIMGGTVDDGPAFDKGKFGKGMKAERGGKKKDFDDWDL